MKVIALFGPGETAKREHLFKIKKSFDLDSSKSLDLKKSSISDLVVELSSPSLFETGERLIVVENISESVDIDSLPNSENTTMVLVASGIKTGSVLDKSLQKTKAQIVKFEAEKELNAFPFVDAFLEKKNTAFLELEKLMKEYGFMYVLTMVYYGLRRNFQPPSKSDFMRQKVTKQKSLNDAKRLKDLYLLTLQTEYEIKSGKIPEDIAIFSLVNKIIN